MLERKTVVDQIEIRRDGSVGVRLALLIVDGAKEAGKEYHRVSFDAGADVAALFDDLNSALQGNGYEPVSQPDILRIMEHSQHAAAAD